MKQKMSKRKAKRLSLIKWKLFKDTGCNYREFEVRLRLGKYLELEDLMCHCGYCEKYRDRCGSSNSNSCNKCPLFKLWGHSCVHNESLWKQWHEQNLYGTAKERKRISRKIYKDIERS
jgi:hypothetical protein